MKSRGWIVLIAVVALGAWWWWRTPAAPDAATDAATEAPATRAPAAAAGATNGAAIAAGARVAAPTAIHTVAMPAAPRAAAADVVAAARDRAKDGDANAAFDAYGALSRCWGYSDLIAQSARPMRDLPTDQPARDLRLQALANEHRVAAESLARDCIGYEAPTIDDRLRWLDAAAAGGSAVARTYYAQELLTMLRKDPEWMIRNPDEFARAAGAAREYTALAAADGSREAMLTMGNLYAEGSLFPKDVVEGYAWLAAALPAGTAGNSERLRELTSQMTPEQLSLANQRAQQLRGG